MRLEFQLEIEVDVWQEPVTFVH